jgi:hypothetical protein
MPRDPGELILARMDSTAIVMCSLCGHRIGVYEPVTVLGADGSRLTSRAREPRVVQQAVILMHAGCFGEVEAERIRG